MSEARQWRGYADEHTVLPGDEIVQGLDLYWERGRADAMALVSLAERLFGVGGDDGRQQGELILRNLAREHLPEHALQKHRDTAVLGPSFRAELVTQRQFVKAAEEAGGHSPGSAALTQRGPGRSFATKLKLPVAPLLQRNVPWTQINPAAQTVIKPVKGDDAHGVFLVFAKNDILELRTGARFSDWQKLKRHARDVERYLGVRRWTVEDMLHRDGSGLAVSLKFYVFYGEVALVRETDRENGTTCWYDRQGDVVLPCKSAENSHVGDGLPEGAVKKVEQVSREIPAPFISLGVLVAQRGLHYGDFATEPVGVDDFTLAADRILGEKHLDAQARLYADMLQGKSFNIYTSHADSWAKKRSKAQAPREKGAV